MNAFERRQSRKERLVVLLTVEEKAIVQEQAERSNLSMSEFLRQAVMTICSQQAPPHKSDDQPE